MTTRILDEFSDELEHVPFLYFDGEEIIEIEEEFFEDSIYSHKNMVYYPSHHYI